MRKEYLTALVLIGAAITLATTGFRFGVIDHTLASVIGARYSDVAVGGAVARVYFPDNLPDTGARAVLLLHGNGHSHQQFLGLSALRAIKSGQSILATVDGQDFAQPPFATSASGWGNDEYQRRYLELYRYLVDQYQIEPAVDVIGASMGGLALGRFIVDGSIPIRNAYGLGPVPSLETIFIEGGEWRRAPIRNAFGMASDGSQDSALRDFAADAFWLDALPASGGALPPLMIYAGSGDTVFTTEFGGTEAYTALCSRYVAAGGQCEYTEAEGLGHDSVDLLASILTQIDGD
jgi:acetyl esterase/lipase